MDSCTSRATRKPLDFYMRNYLTTHLRSDESQLWASQLRRCHPSGWYATSFPVGLARIIFDKLPYQSVTGDRVSCFRRAPPKKHQVSLLSKQAERNLVRAHLPAFTAKARFQVALFLLTRFRLKQFSLSSRIHLSRTAKGISFSRKDTFP